MPKMKIAVVPKAGADFELQEREIPQPGPGQVRVRVQACGVCFGDVLVKNGLWPGFTFPPAPRRPIAGPNPQPAPGRSGAAQPRHNPGFSWAPPTNRRTADL